MLCLIINLFSELLSKSHNKYGSVVKLWLGPSLLLVSVKDPVLIKEVLLKAEDKLPLIGRAFQLAFGPSSLFSSSFDKVHCKDLPPCREILLFIFIFLYYLLLVKLNVHCEHINVYIVIFYCINIVTVG